MNITYIHHSSFLVETESRYLLFDYFQGELPRMNPEKALYVFASHRHGDHFSTLIFELADKFKDIHYVLSDDIWRKRVPEEQIKCTTFAGAGQSLPFPGMQAETLKSTDEGVAFLIQVDGKSIYHAGDLNDWYWEGEPKRDNDAMTQAYRYQIDKLKGRKLDAAFVVLDPRQGKDYDRGIRYFLEQTEAEKVYPMHWWGDPSVIERCRGEAWAAPYRDCIVDEAWY